MSETQIPGKHATSIPRPLNTLPHNGPDARRRPAIPHLQKAQIHITTNKILCRMRVPRTGIHP